VRTAAELDSVIAKTLMYEVKDYGRTAIFAADEFDGVSYSAYSESFIGELPEGWRVERAYMGDLGVAEARRVLLEAMNEGVALTSFVGHSSYDRWTFQGLFFSADAAILANAGRPTVVTQWGCWNTYYVQPSYNTLAHKLLLSGDRGAAAVLGAATLTEASSDKAFGQLLMPRIVQPGVTIGAAIQAAKEELAATQPDLVDVLLGWTLLGDPALVLEP